MSDKPEKYTISLTIEGDGVDALNIRQWLDDRVAHIRTTPEFPPVRIGQIEKRTYKSVAFIRATGLLLAAGAVGLPIAKLAGFDIPWEVATSPIWGTMMFFCATFFMWLTLHSAHSIIKAAKRIFE